MRQLDFEASSEEDTCRFGGALARALPTTATIALVGTLGAGKTYLVQAVAAARGIGTGLVTSPTFVLCQHYFDPDQRPIYHLDAYRVRDPDEFLELGVEEYFEGPGLTFIEWADRVSECLPNDRLEIHIEVTGQRSRTFALVADGPNSEATLARLRVSLSD